MQAGDLQDARYAVVGRADDRAARMLRVDVTRCPLEDLEACPVHELHAAEVDLTAELEDDDLLGRTLVFDLGVIVGAHVVCLHEGGDPEASDRQGLMGTASPASSACSMPSPTPSPPSAQRSRCGIPEPATTSVASPCSLA